jgi:D-3-phosphoglycerate dehydrogenase
MVSSTKRRRRILVVGDSYMPTTVFSAAMERLAAAHDIRFLQIDESRVLVPETRSERSLREHTGSPEEIIEQIDDVEILVVHGAPVTDAVLERPSLQLVCCARGGPVNVDVEAASRRGLPVVTTPGKNAEAVAELTIAFLIMLARGVRAAQAFVEGGGVVRSAFEGSRFFGGNLSGRVLGLVGFGNVGRMVAPRAHALRLRVLAFDPNVDDDELERAHVEAVDLLTLLNRSDFVSLHARAGLDNENLFDAEAFAGMKAGSYFINTARETLVDESALGAALASRHLAGAALDVVRPYPGGAPHPLLAHPNVIITPHIGGATQETLFLGARMVAEEITRFVADEPLRWLANGSALAGSRA